MSSTVLRRWIRVSAILMIPAVPVSARAQEATVSGTVTDSTGGVLPGVTIKAVNDASGNSFEAVTDARGAYRLAVRIGGYQITATLVGFGTLSRRAGAAGRTDEPCINLQLAPSTVQESVTVTGEAPLIATDHLERERQHRSEADVGAAGARPQLDVARAAGAREPDERRRAPFRCRTDTLETSGISAQRRRPAGDGGSSAPATRPGTARTRSRNFSSSRTGSTRRRAGRPACR